MYCKKAQRALSFGQKYTHFYKINRPSNNAVANAAVATLILVEKCD